MTEIPAAPVGREARARARGQSRTLLRTRAVDLIAGEAPWLLRADLPVPAEAHGQLLELQGQILRQARSRSEAAGMNGVLQDLVDRHNARSRSSPVAAPGAITAVYSKDDNWRLEDLQFAAEARRLRVQYWKIREEGLTWQVSADQLFGLCLASALFESACLTPAHLQLFAQSLLSEETVLYRAEGVPVWLDLKERSHSSARRTRALSVASGKDAEGLYALRRLFPASPTLRLISLFWNLPTTARQSLRPDHPVPEALAKAFGEALPPSLRLPQLLRGAALLREAEEDGPDHLLKGLAQRRIKSFAATPETWARALTGGAASGEALRKSPAVWSRELTAPPERRVTRLSHPVLQSEGYLRFYMALHDIRPEDEGEGEAAAARQRRPGDLARDLRAARTGGDWPDVLCLLSDWYLHLLESEGLRPSSVERYDDTLGLRLCMHLEDLPLRDLAAEDLEDLYGEILEDDPRSPAERRNLARRLRSLHDFAMSAWKFPKIDPETFSMEGDTPALRVRANLLSFRDLTTARLSLASAFGLPPDLARTLQAAFLLMARCGLRIGEVCKALAAHFENPEGTPVPEEMATLFIRSSRFGTNKTPNALRQIRPMLLMTREERAFFSDWLAWRRSLSPGPLFGILQPDGTFAPLDRLATGRLIAVALRGASGLSMVSAHDLRRTALNNIALALGEARAPALALTERLTGWTSEERRAVVQAVAGVSQRERWEALARFAGHGSVETTFLHYITCADLLIWQSCASGEQKELPADHLSGPAAERLCQLLPESEEKPCDQSKRTWPSLQDSAAALHALRIALDCLDRGLALPRAAAAASLPEELLVQTASVAKRWSALRSARGELRLQKKGDEGRLLPASLPAPKLREALDLAARLIDLAADQPQAVYSWIRSTLSQASRTNAGVTFRDPADATVWIALAVQLRPAGRWQFERVSPQIDPELRRARELSWQGVRPEEMQRAARRVSRGSSVQVRLRLMAPDGPEQGPRPAGSWAGVVTVAAHYAAIWLQLAPDQGAEDAEAVE